MNDMNEAQGGGALSTGGPWKCWPSLPSQLITRQHRARPGATDLYARARERLKSDPSNVAWLNDRLKARGLVERRPDPSNRRIKGLALTSAGGQVRERLFAPLYSAPASIAALSSAISVCYGTCGSA